MRLYHFRDEKYGIRSLKEKRLKIARIHELNDPFELLGCELSDKRRRQAFQNMKAKLSKSKGLLCFSRNWRSPVQWAHYSNNHKGICMGFEIPEKWLTKVDYQSKRLPCPTDFNIEFMNKVLSIKFSHWKYEREYRVFIDLDQTREENGLYFYDFTENLKLNQVIVGCNSELKRKDIKQAIGNLHDDVEVFKTRPAFKSFNIVMNRNKRLWT